MQKKTLGPELTRAINRTARAMAAQVLKDEAKDHDLGLLKVVAGPLDVA